MKDKKIVAAEDLKKQSNKCGNLAERMRSTNLRLSRMEPRRSELMSEFNERWQKVKIVADEAGNKMLEGERTLANMCAEYDRQHGGDSAQDILGKGWIGK
jgi:hypothetical protein